MAMVDLHRRSNKPALAAMAVSLPLYGAVAALVEGPGQTPLWLAAYIGAWLFYLWVFARNSEDDHVASPWLVLGWAAAARLLLVDTPIWLSDDLWRYLLDGQVLLEGINPFRFPPDHPQIMAIAPELAAKVNHPSVPTVYPPLAQAAGALAAFFGWGATAWRVFMTVIDLTVVAAVARLFGGGARGWRAAAVYGWCPLAIFESGANGHLEPLVFLPLILAVDMLERGQSGRAGIALGLSILAKYFPMVLIPALLKERNSLKMLVLTTLVVGLGLMPFLLGGVDIFAGMKVYLGHWAFNSPLHDGLSQLLGGGSWVRALPFAVVGAAGLIAAIRGESPRQMIPLLLFAFLVIGPTLHPWYALWVLPWLGDRPHEGLWAFVAAMGGSYAVWWQVHLTGEWILPPGVALLLWGIVALGWLLAIAKNGRADPEALDA